MLRFAHQETPLGPMDGNIGVRLVKTQNEAIGCAHERDGFRWHGA